MFETLIQKAVLMIAIVSGIPLVVSAIVGLCVSVVQAATQVQDQSLTYTIKLITLGVVLYLWGGFFSIQLVTFFQQLLGSLPLLS